MILHRPDAYRALRSAEAELARLESCAFAKDAVDEVARAKLDSLLARARTTPYYHDLLGDVASVPVTPKSAVKGRPDLFRVPGSRAVKYYETSGTTGQPTPTWREPADIVWNVVSVAASWRRVLESQERVATLLPSDVAPIGDLVSNVCEYLGLCLVRCYPFALGICDWDRLEPLLARYRPTCLFAAPGVLVQLMRVLQRRGSFADLRESVSTIMLLGEVSTPGMRSMLGQRWEAKVLDASYGSTETSTVAATCVEGSLHALTHACLVELDRGGELAPPGPHTSGELVVTPLNSQARTLLRYAIGDRADVSTSHTCGCGLHLPTVVVHGRAGEAVEVNGSSLDVGAVEGVVYALPAVTGYLIELDGTRGSGRLLLERAVDAEVSDQEQMAAATEAFGASGVRWDDVVVLSELPALTKSNGGQKNWKRTNVRVRG